MFRFVFTLLIIIIAFNKSTVAQSENISTVKFIFYYGPDITNNEIFNVENNWKILNHSLFNNSKLTACYIHGYTENKNSESLQIIVKSYLKRLTDYNLIVLDWSKLAKGRYIYNAVKNTLMLGDELGETFNKFFENGMNIKKFHLIGHSLGGHLAGFIGRTMQKISRGKIKLSRITALDPAFPGFYILPLRKPVNANDAQFVDIIHTDGWIYGGPLSTGTVDFWPNRGDLTQPGCPKRDFRLLTEVDLCSHRQSWKYWAETVSKQYNIEFWAAKAQSWQDFRIRSQFVQLPIAEMGSNCPTNITGNYYLQTNFKPPFAKGLSGASYNNKEMSNNSQKYLKGINKFRFKYNYQ